MPPTRVEPLSPRLEENRRARWQIPTRDCSWRFRCRIESPRLFAILRHPPGCDPAGSEPYPQCCGLRCYRAVARVTCDSESARLQLYPFEEEPSQDSRGQGYFRVEDPRLLAAGKSRRPICLFAKRQYRGYFQQRRCLRLQQGRA